MNYYNEIKQELLNNEITKKVKNYAINKSDLLTYYNVGKMLSEAGKHYGEGIIKEYSKKLTLELGKGYTNSNLKRLRQFYIIIQKGATLSHQLSWSHYVELLPFENINMINYYIRTIEIENLSVRQLREKIKTKEYERLPEETKNKLINEDKLEIKDLIPNPIVIKNANNIEVVTEKILHKLILEDIENFMHELGDNFCFVGSKYKIKIGDQYNYIDLLLFNFEYNCFVVVELKITKLKKEYIGQVEVYMNYIDNNLRKQYHDKTIGIIICKENNKFVMEYCSDKRILAREYKIM